ncbi:hypothetical protein GF250_21745 [Salmonella enterica subsp. enterica serovar Virchow]|nr:hypothetical protein [Salmonella enterica subsp. enterica serovar Virchow]
MISSTIVISAWNSLINTLKALESTSREQAKQTSEAIKSLTKAIHETEIYFSSRVRGAERDFEREQILSRYWSDSAEPLRIIDAYYFSDLCALKAKYWLFPEQYSREEVKLLNITLEGMNAELQKLRYLP